MVTGQIRIFLLVHLLIWAMIDGIVHCMDLRFWSTQQIMATLTISIIHRTNLRNSCANHVRVMFVIFHNLNLTKQHSSLLLFTQYSIEMWRKLKILKILNPLSKFAQLTNSIYTIIITQLEDPVVSAHTTKLTSKQKIVLKSFLIKIYYLLCANLNRSKTWRVDSSHHL